MFVWEAHVDLQPPGRGQFRRHLIASSPQWMLVLQKEAANCSFCLSWLAVLAIATYYPAVLLGTLNTVEGRYRLVAATKRHLTAGVLNKT